MTDNEIIKALECCFVNSDCTGYPANEYPRGIDCLVQIGKETLAFINRQEAEIEEQDQAIIKALKHMGEIRSEAIKEFAERLKDSSCIRYVDEMTGEVYQMIISGSTIDYLVKK